MCRALLSPEPLMSSTRLIAGLCGLFAATALAAGTDELSEYRLSGTINNSNSRWLAVVDVPGDGQQLVRIGDQLAGADVIEIGDNTIRLAIGARVWTLDLEGLQETGPRGNTKLPANITATTAMRADLTALATNTTGNRRTGSVGGIGNSLPATRPQDLARDGGPGDVGLTGGGLMGGGQTGTAQRSQSESNQSAATKSASNNPESSDPVTNNPETSNPETSDPVTNNPEVTEPEEVNDPEAVAASIATEMRNILNLPPEASIVTIDHQPVTMTEQGLNMLNNSLETGQETGIAVRIGITGVPDTSAVYLMPEVNDANSS